MEMPPLLDGFLVSTAAGAGQGLGQILMTWLLQRWRTMTGTARPIKVADLALNLPLANGETPPTNTPASTSANTSAEANPAESSPMAAIPHVAAVASHPDGVSTTLDAGSAAAPPPELVRAVESSQTASDWAKVLDELQQFGVDLPRSAATELAAMQQSVLDRVSAPALALGRLAELTAQAFEQSGIEPADLRRWQRVEDCLAGDPDLESLGHGSSSSSAPSLASVAVAPLARPSTWFAWTREELDRRLTTYLRRAVRRCDQSCELALRTTVDCELALLRELRSWRGDLSVLEQFLSSLPPLHVKTRSLRPLSGRGKEATRALEEAALVATGLLETTTRLFQQPVGSASWSQQLLVCRQATARLTQQVRERRDLRQ
jgi:hypothetical protein